MELFAPLDGASDIGSFLNEKGEGIHHICYEVDDLDETLNTLRAKGLKLQDEKPRPGSRNSRIAFVDPAGTGGALTECCRFPRT